MYLNMQHLPMLVELHTANPDLASSHPSQTDPAEDQPHPLGLDIVHFTCLGVNARFRSITSANWHVLCSQSNLIGLYNGRGVRRLWCLVKVLNKNSRIHFAVLETEGRYQQTEGILSYKIRDICSIWSSYAEGATKERPK